MKNISVLIEGTATKTFRFKKPIVTYGTRLAASSDIRVIYPKNDRFRILISPGILRAY